MTCRLCKYDIKCISVFGRTRATEMEKHESEPTDTSRKVKIWLEINKINVLMSEQQ